MRRPRRLAWRLHNLTSRRRASGFLREEASLSTEKRSIRVLHVNGDEGEAAFVARALQRGRESFAVHRVADLDDAKLELENGRYDVLLIDLDSEESESRQAFDFIRSNPMTATVVLSSHPAHRDASEALRYGAEDFLERSNVSEERLRRSLAMAVDRHQCLERLALRPMPGTVVQMIEDLRNQLTVAILSLDAAAQRLPDDSTVSSLHDRARSSLRQAASLTQEIDDARKEYLRRNPDALRDDAERAASAR